ncbi:zinc-binding dehydrogenase domain-containing protein [Sarocladium implicatum]|nr:zinc-binding dehydrogenase domain-containing protein [Sarocladium implicatum]
MVQNKSFVYKKLPSGLPVAGEHLVTEDRPLDIENTPLPPGGLILKIKYASFDPYLRGKMRDPNTKSYAPAFNPDDVIVNTCIGEVVKANDSPDYKVGDLVLGFVPIGEYAVVPDPKARMVRKVQNPHDLDLGHFLGALGMPGLTGWSGLHKIGQPKKGETLFLSSAAGAVGQVVGQVAKREGLRVIGSVGSDDKLDFITKELGFDAGFNYKKESPADALKRLAPEGIDIYFENVGAEHLEAALNSIRDYGRVAVCGLIADYNKPAEKRSALKNYHQILFKQLKVEGFLVGSPGFGPAYFKEHQENMQAWIKDGSVKAKLHITEGIDNAAEGFIGMLEGDNFGKAVLKI